MLNLINSYSNNNTSNNFLVFKNSQNTENLNKITNSSNSKIENSTQSSLNKNSIKNKSKAVNEILGYKVDKVGYFTEEFNKAAKIPQDYKIHSTSVQKYINAQTSSFSGYSNIDIAQTFKNGFKIFSQLLNDKLASKQSFTQEDLASLPQAYDLDKKSLNVIKTYTLDEQEYKDYVNQALANRSPSEDIIKTTSFDLLAGENFNEEFKYALDKIGGDKYINADGFIDKGGVFMAFIVGRNVNFAIREGQTTIWGKLQGFDEGINASTLRQLEEFMEQNPAEAALFEKMDLLNSNLSIDEFKDKWLKLKEISDKRKAKWKEESNFNRANFMQNASQNEEEKSAFTPIQVKSKSEIYKDSGFFTLKDILKNQQDLDRLSILFDTIKSNGNRFLNRVDIRA